MKSKKSNFKSFIFLLALLAFLLIFAVGMKNFKSASIIGEKILAASDSLGLSDLSSGNASDLTSLRLIKKVKLDLSILKNWKFLSLIENGRAPKVRDKGRANPFLPF